jgi:hypothetical protein
MNYVILSSLVRQLEVFQFHIFWEVKGVLRSKCHSGLRVEAFSYLDRF